MLAMALVAVERLVDPVVAPVRVPAATMLSAAWVMVPATRFRV